MRFAAHDHLGQAGPLCRALQDAGHVFDPNGPTDLFLIDLDPDKYGYREMIDFYRDQGATILQYPHGAPNATLQYDCLYEPYEGVDGQLTHGPGEIAYLRAIGLERPARVMGWQLCRQFKPRPPKVPKRVTFAPMHVPAHGAIIDYYSSSNAEVFRQLLGGPWELVVRYIGDLERLGLWQDERVHRYVPGDLDMTTVEIDSADCVVAGAGTYPCLAIARGVPTIMYEQLTAIYGDPDEEVQPLRRVDRYRDILRYPAAAEDGPLPNLIDAVCRDPEMMDAAVNWRERWIGQPFDPAAFTAMVEEWVPELQGADWQPAAPPTVVPFLV